MIVAVMQPYFFPYIGYFQLMKAVELFVVYDDVQYIKGGWINRNRIRGTEGPQWLTMPVLRGSLDLHINQRRYDFSGGDAVQGIRHKLRACYGKFEWRNETDGLIGPLLDFDETNVAAYNANLLEALARKMGIACRFMVSSCIEKPGHLRGQAKVIDLCRRVGATHYINPAGGMELYDEVAFYEAGLELSFLRTDVAATPFGGGDYQLSIIDHLMKHGLVGTSESLGQFSLVSSDRH